ncbi:TPA: YeeE/YedE family protein [Pseudomonas aeruginosa]|nr:YeeE/YedE family protein [Pseudomonas aeruginosa]
MIDTMSISMYALIAILAFPLGYIANQSGTCLVAAAQEVLYFRRAWLIGGIALAAMSSTMIFLLLPWVVESKLILIPTFPDKLNLIIGAILLGVGAFINDACLLGSLGRIGNGELRMFALPFGLAIGLLLTKRTFLDSRSVQPPYFSELTQPTLTSYLLTTLTCVFLLTVLINTERHRKIPLGSTLRATLFGIAGGLIFTIKPNWTLASLVDDLTSERAFTISFIAVLATLAGSVVSSRRLGTFTLKLPSAHSLVKTIIAGGLMGSGIALIPGGNDSLLLQALPSSSFSALLALTTMFITILLPITIVKLITGHRMH